MKKILFAILVLSLALIIIGLGRSIYDLWRKQDLVISYQKQLAKQKQENQNLKQNLSTTGNPGFVEQQARDSLFLTKPGEQSVILPRDLLTGTNSAKPIEDSSPNWKKWWNLFF